MQGRNKQTTIRTFEIDVSVSGFLDGGISDWPANVQDAVFKALERVSKREQLPLTIVMSRCAIDYDVNEGQPGRFYLHCIASEIVVADQRTVRERVVAELPDDIRRLLN